MIPCGPQSDIFHFKLTFKACLCFLCHYLNSFFCLYKTGLFFPDLYIKIICLPGFQTSRFSFHIYVCFLSIWIQFILQICLIFQNTFFCQDQLHFSVDSYRIYISLDKCIRMFVGTFYHISFYQGGSGILCIQLHLIIPWRTYLYNEIIFLSKNKLIFYIKGKWSGISFMLSKKFSVKPYFSIIIHIGKFKDSIRNFLIRNFKLCFVPPGCLIEISQFTPEIWLSGIDKLQMFQFLQFLPFRHLGTYGSICFPGSIKPDLFPCIMNILQNFPSLFQFNPCFHFSLLTLDRTCSHTFDYVPVKNKIHDQCRQDRYYDRRKCTSPVHSSELPHKVIQANWKSFHIRR